MRSRLALAIAMAPCLAAAEEIPLDSLDALKSPYVVATSGNALEPRSQATAATSIFTRKDISRLKVKSVPDLLTRVPGMSVAQQGGRGSRTSLYLRGTNANQTLVLIDGVRIGSLSDGLSRLEYLNLEQVERVEVTRGARSSLYGSDAMGGVIQVFTRRGEGAGLEPRFDFSLGDSDENEHSLGLSGGDERTRFDLGASLLELHSDRTDDIDGANTDDDTYRNRGFNLSLEHRLTEQWRAGLNLLDQRGKSDLDENALWYPGQPTDEFTLNSTSAFLEANLDPRWTSRLQLGHAENRSQLDTVRNFFTTHQEFATYRDSVEWQNTLRLDEHQQVLLGAEWYEERLTANRTLNEMERRNQAWFAQHRYRAAPFGTELGLRHDSSDQYGSEDSLNAALDFDLPMSTQLVLSYAEGFRVPNMVELYLPAPFQPNGNPDLDPEHSKTWEAQLRGSHYDTDWSFGVYRTDIEDLISPVLDFNPFFVNEMRNVGKARINGMDLSASRDFMGWNTHLNLGLVDPRDRDTGHTLPGRSRRTLVLDVDKKFGDYNFGFSWTGVSSRYVDAENTEKTPGYGRIDIRAGWSFLKGLKVETRVENIGNRQITEQRYVSSSNPSSSYPFGDGTPTSSNTVNVVDPTIEQYGGYQDEGRKVVMTLKWSPQF
ncbi:MULTISPECIES: TonB-dependent receptor plug domain-containing protein [unclassified Pseudomonas]|jgi:vitamin B12 transporter|uniref:TonB-dependent receptor plug domain-containing protein n=1 Tax=unclassified Pseudomonas TaxID=196821 RepID=UPI000DA87202|nr:MULTISPECIES: TonB-dependent receptor [unclassified Pseudomonas]MDW3714314.1 TonB-dependent receptor [Pseudomonas sp. 2023EL-01195]PZE13827.1 TonB-dependent receptor [Pseudomonas sp. 57B-090624]